MVRPEKSGISAELSSCPESQFPLMTLYSKQVVLRQQLIVGSMFLCGCQGLSWRRSPRSPALLVGKPPRRGQIHQFGFFEWRESFFSVFLMFRLQGGAVSLHPALLRPQAMQAVSQQPLLLQVRRNKINTQSFSILPFCQSKTSLKFVGQTRSAVSHCTFSSPTKLLSLRFTYCSCT